MKNKEMEVVSKARIMFESLADSGTSHLIF